MLSDRTKEEWRELCRQAVHEEDPNKLMTLIAEIDWRLEARERQLPADRGGKTRS
jgi:hypothetical protein